MPFLLLLSIRLRGPLTLWLCLPSVDTVPTTLSSSSRLEVTWGQKMRLLLTHSLPADASPLSSQGRTWLPVDWGTETSSEPGSKG